MDQPFPAVLCSQLNHSEDVWLYPVYLAHWEALDLEHMYSKTDV